jgi:hypothetical protein
VRVGVIICALDGAWGQISDIERAQQHSQWSSRCAISPSWKHVFRPMVLRNSAVVQEHAASFASLFVRASCESEGLRDGPFFLGPTRALGATYTNVHSITMLVTCPCHEPRVYARWLAHIRSMPQHTCCARPSNSRCWDPQFRCMLQHPQQNC